MNESVPQGASRAILSDVPDSLCLINNIVDFEYIFVVHFPEFFIDMLLFIDIVHVCVALLDFADGDGVVKVIIEYPEDLAKTRCTCAKLPSPMSSALLRSNYFLKWFDLILIIIINQKNPLTTLVSVIIASTHQAYLPRVLSVKRANPSNFSSSQEINVREASNTL